LANQNGLKKGDASSLLLFSLSLEKANREIQEKGERLKLIETRLVLP
jgi:hypothetical protein